MPYKEKRCKRETLGFPVTVTALLRKQDISAKRLRFPVTMTVLLRKQDIIAKRLGSPDTVTACKENRTLV